MDKHNLKNDFPQFSEKITELKTSNQHFRKLYDEYHEANNHIYNVEMGADTASDELMNSLRSKRLHLKDELYTMLITQ